jgi:trans-aconitate methyltransferase
MSAEGVRVSPHWLRLREPADAAARAHELVERLRRRLVPAKDIVVHDLGCGTGAMGRWLAPRLAGRQRWVIHDRDNKLLQLATDSFPAKTADQASITVQARLGDITRLTADDLAGATLVTASALLDMMGADELERLVRTCAQVGCPALLTLSVIGQVQLFPADSLDEAIGSAFNAHQRRTTGGRQLLGPDAAAAAVEAFTRYGAEVLVRPSPWRLGASRAGLAAEWLNGWVEAACEQRPDLTVAAAAYIRRRRTQAMAGRLRVTVHHQDLLAWHR